MSGHKPWSEIRHKSSAKEGPAPREMREHFVRRQCLNPHPHAPHRWDFIRICSGVLLDDLALECCAECGFTGVALVPVGNEWWCLDCVAHELGEQGDDAA